MLRIPGAVLLFVPLLGCQDYGLSGKDQVPAGGIDSETAPTIETAEACDALMLPLSGPLPVAPATCSAVDANWDVVIEADFYVPRLFNAAGFAPYIPGESPEILVCALDPMARLVRMTALDSARGAMRPSEGVYADCSSFAWGVGEGGRTVGAFGHVIEQGGLALTTDPNGPWTNADASPAEALPVLADLDGDGAGEVLYGNDAFHTDARVVASFGDAIGRFWMTAADVVAGGALEVVAPDGVYDFSGARVGTWSAEFLDVPYYIQGVIPLRVEEGIRYFASDWKAVWAFDENGSEVWRHSWDTDGSVYVGGYWAVGEANGDGRPEMCLFAGDQVVVIDIDGEVLLEAPTGDALAAIRGGCAMADLDGDGNDEVVTYDASGVRIYDVATQSLLAHRPDICSTTWQTPPAIADVDGDGSGELLVVGGPAPCTDDAPGGGHVYVLGPSEGRWSRTRPVWNQLPYDPALIADDGRLVTNPAWSNRFRSQPGRDGEWPDLAPELVEVCVEDCESGNASWSVRVRNTGSADAPAGTQVALISTTTGDVALGTIDAAIPAGWASAAIRLEARAADLVGPLRIEVHNDAISECDPGNDRLDLEVPCAGG